MIDDPPPDDTVPPSEGDGAPREGELPFAMLEMQADTRGLPDAGAPLAEDGRLNLVLEVPVRLSVELGRTDIPIREVVNLGRGSIIELDRGPGTPLDVRINGVLIGRGEVVLVNEDRLGLRFVEVVSQAERAKRVS